MDKPHLLGHTSELLKAIWGNELDYRQMFTRGLKILAQREKVAANTAQVSHGREQLFFGFAEAKHETRFRVNAVTAADLYFPKNAQRAIISCTRTNVRRESPNRFKVVIENFRLGRKHGFDGGI